MIIKGSKLQCVDNTSVETVECIDVVGGNVAILGGLIKVSIKSLRRNRGGSVSKSKSTHKKGNVVMALIVRSKAPYRRSDGSSIRFNNNAVVILSNDLVPYGSRVLVAIGKEAGFVVKQVTSLAKVVV